MPETTWFVSVNGAQAEGQRTTAEVRQMLAADRSANVLVWRDGMPSWSDARSLPELAPAPAPAPAVPQPTAAATPPAYVSPAPAFPGGGSGIDLKQQAGFLKALFDFKFEAFVTPKMISALYLLSMILIGLGVLAMILSSGFGIITAFRFGGIGGAIMPFFMLLLSPVFGVLYLAFARMFFEIVIVLFKIKDNTETMAGK
jgi:hypothetical protein